MLTGMAFQSGVTAVGSRSHLALTWLVAIVLVACIGLFVGVLVAEVWRSVQFARKMAALKIAAARPGPRRRSATATSGWSMANPLGPVGSAGMAIGSMGSPASPGMGPAQRGDAVGWDVPRPDVDGGGKDWAGQRASKYVGPAGGSANAGRVAFGASGRRASRTGPPPPPPGPPGQLPRGAQYQALVVARRDPVPAVPGDTSGAVPPRGPSQQVVVEATARASRSVTATAPGSCHDEDTQIDRHARCTGRIPGPLAPPVTPVNQGSEQAIGAVGMSMTVAGGLGRLARISAILHVHQDGSASTSGTLTAAAGASRASLPLEPSGLSSNLNAP